MTTKFLITILIISTRSHLGCFANKTPECIGVGPDNNPKQQKLAARDAITLSIFDVQEIWKFAHRVTHLKSIFHHLTPELVNCLQDFIVRSKGIEDSLRNLRHLKSPELVSSTQSLETTTLNALNLGAKCRETIGHFDAALSTLLDNKLLSVRMLIDNTVYLVHKLGNGSTNPPNCT